MERSAEEIDLGALTERLRETFDAGLPEGYVRALTVFRDAVQAVLGCSELRSEEIVDTMIARGFIRHRGDPGRVAAAEVGWELDPEPVA